MNRLNSTTVQLGLRNLLILSVKATFLLDYFPQVTKYVLIWASQDNYKEKKTIISILQISKRKLRKVIRFALAKLALELKCEPWSYTNTIVLSTIPQCLNKNNLYSTQKDHLFRLWVFRPRKARKRDRRINTLDLIQRHCKQWISSKSALEKQSNVEHI